MVHMDVDEHPSVQTSATSLPSQQTTRRESEVQRGPNPAEFRKTVFTGQLSVNIDDKAALEKEAFRYAQELQKLLTEANVVRTEIDRESAEALIEKDFLTKPRYHE